MQRRPWLSQWPPREMTCCGSVREVDGTPGKAKRRSTERERAPRTRRLEPFPSAGRERPVKPCLSAVPCAPRSVKTGARQPGYINERSIAVLHAFLYVAQI